MLHYVRCNKLVHVICRRKPGYHREERGKCVTLFEQRKANWRRLPVPLWTAVVRPALRHLRALTGSRHSSWRRLATGGREWCIAVWSGLLRKARSTCVRGGRRHSGLQVPGTRYPCKLICRMMGWADKWINGPYMFYWPTVAVTGMKKVYLSVCLSIDCLSVCPSVLITWLESFLYY